MTDTPVPTVVPAARLRLPGSTTRRFEGRDHGAGVSYFLVDHEPGRGAARHRHPYDETWVVLAGRAAADVGGRHVEIGVGDSVVVPPHTWHGFTSLGPDRLRLIGVHSSPVIVQEQQAGSPQP